MAKKAAKKKKTTKKPVAKKAAAKATRKSPKKAPKKVAKGLHFTSGAPSITVDDAAASLAWYCDVLGFTVKNRWEREGVLLGGELVAGDATIYVGQDDWKMGRDRKKGEGLRLYWATRQNIDQLAAAIKARGGTLASEPRDEYGMRSFNLVDPTGYKITISSDR